MNIRKAIYALTGLVFSALLGYGAALPLLPSTATYSEPSQIVGTINALINQLNGQTGYAPAQIVTTGSFAVGTAASPGPVTVNASRGIATYTATPTIADGASLAVTISDSLVTASSMCMAQIVVDGTAAGSAPFIRSVTPSAGTLTITISNGSPTATGATTTNGIGFACFN